MKPSTNIQFYCAHCGTAKVAHRYDWCTICERKQMSKRSTNKLGGPCHSQELTKGFNKPHQGKY